MLTFARKHRIISEYYSLNGSTRKFGKRLAARRLIWMLGLSLLLLLLMLATHLVLPDSIGTPLSAVFGGASILLLLAAPFTLLFRIKTMHLFLNTHEEIEELIVKYAPEKDRSLDAIVDQIAPLETKRPTHKPGPFTRIHSDWLSAFPLQFVFVSACFAYAFLYSIFDFVLDLLNDAGIENLPAWTVWLALLPLLAIILYTLWKSIEGKGAWGHRAYRRAAIRAFAKGDIEAGEAALVNILSDSPGDVDARLLLAHVCIAAGRYDDALGCLELVAEEGTEARQEMALQLETVRAMEEGFDAVENVPNTQSPQIIDSHSDPW